MRFTNFVPPLVALAAPFALVSCADPAPLYVDQAWIRLNPNPAGPAAGYLVIHGGEEPVKLLRVSSEGAMRIEMHESAMKDGMMTMKPVENVDVPAKTEVKFAPGGKHLMIYDINPAYLEAGKLTMTMLFSNGDRLIVDAAIQKGGGDHEGHEKAPAE